MTERQTDSRALFEKCIISEAGNKEHNTYKWDEYLGKYDVILVNEIDFQKPQKRYATA